MDRMVMRQLAFTRGHLFSSPQIAKGNFFYPNFAIRPSTQRESLRTFASLQKHSTVYKHERCKAFQGTGRNRNNKWNEPGHHHRALVYPRLYSTATAAASTTPTEPTPTQHLSIEELDDSSFESEPDVKLSTEQRFLLDQIINKKKSIFFTGSAGTGKSVLLRQLIKELKEVYKPGQVAVTASTGIAACNIGGCTLHSFAGIRNGSGTLERILSILAEKNSSTARGRWKKVKVLIIDEISMIDGDTFDKLEHIARVIKKNDLPFGGIQLVITGDFFQLPPVLGEDFSVPASISPRAIMRTRRHGSGSTTTIIKRASSNNISEDDDHFGEQYFSHPPPLEADIQPTLCFDAKSWSKCINTTVQLTEVFRQRDPTFVDMLTEMRHGKLSKETCKVFDGLEREPDYPDDGIKATELFALKNQVEEANFRYLDQLSGPVVVYEAMDDGPLMRHLDKACAAPSRLQIRHDSQVMLIKNLTNTLVNGSMGLVVGFKEDTVFDNSTQQVVQNRFPIVRFEEGDVIITPQEWRMELPNGTVMASRIQVPLILSWAMSIHKSQGQTMGRVKVDMKNVFEAGQAYVALSRATSLAGLQVLNFNKELVTAHPRVGEFYDTLATVKDMIKLEEEEQALELLLRPKKKEKSKKKKNV